MAEWLEMPQRWYCELIDHLIKHDPEATVRDFLNIVSPIEKDWGPMLAKIKQMEKEKAAERLQAVVKVANKKMADFQQTRVKQYPLHIPKPLTAV